MGKTVRIVSVRAYPDDAQKADADKESKALNAGGFQVEGHAEQTIRLSTTLTKAGGDDEALEIVLHLSAHGTHDGKIVFVRDDDDFLGSTTGDPAEIDGIAKLIRGYSSIRGVVLSVCHSDALAKALVSPTEPLSDQRAGSIEFAVGFAGEVSDSAANDFVSVFYAELAHGQSLAIAFSRARTTLEISAPNKPYAERVVLHCLADSGSIFVPRARMPAVPNVSFADARGNDVKDWVWSGDGLTVKVDGPLPPNAGLRVSVNTRHRASLPKAQPGPNDGDGRSIRLDPSWLAGWRCSTVDAWLLTAGDEQRTIAGTRRTVTVVPVRALLPAALISLVLFAQLVWLLRSTVGYVTLATSMAGGAAFVVVSGVFTRGAPPLWSFVTARFGHVVPTRYVWLSVALLMLTSCGATPFVKTTGQSIRNHTRMSLPVGSESIPADATRIRPIEDGGFADASTCFFDEQGCVDPKTPAPAMPSIALWGHEHRDAFCRRHWAIEKFRLQDGEWCELDVTPGTCDVVKREEKLALAKLVTLADPAEPAQLANRLNGVAVVTPQLDAPGFFDDAKIGVRNWRYPTLSAFHLASRGAFTLRWSWDKAPLVRVEVPLSADLVPLPPGPDLEIHVLKGARSLGTTTLDVQCDKLIAFETPTWLKTLTIADAFEWRAKEETAVGLACGVNRSVLVGEVETSDPGGLPALELPVATAPQKLTVKMKNEPEQKLSCSFPSATSVKIGGYRALPEECKKPNIVSINGTTIDHSEGGRGWYCWPDEFQCTPRAQKRCCTPDEAKDWQLYGCKPCS